MDSLGANEYLKQIAVPGASGTVQFQLTIGDYQEAARYHPNRRRINRVRWILSILLILFGINSMLFGDSGVGVIFCVFGVVFPAYLYIVVKRAVRKNFESMKSMFASPIELSYGPGFISHKSVATFGYTTWLYQIIHGKDVRLLMLSNVSYWIVPTRAFESSAMIASFDAITGELLAN